MSLTQISTEGIKDGTITNADIGASAAIAGTKISPDFGSQTITTTGNLNIGDITLTDSSPSITFTENDANPDYKIVVNGGEFRVEDTTNSSDRLAIDSSGRIGIGTTSPKGKLCIDATGLDAAGDPDDPNDYAIVIRNSSTTNQGNGIAFTNNDAQHVGGAIIHVDKGSNNLGDLAFFTAATSSTPLERMRIASNGDIGINTTTINRRDAGRNTIQFDYSGSDASEGLEIRLSNSAITESPAV